MDRIQKFIGIPYLHNGKTINGVDCYGLGILLYRHILGIEINDFDSGKKTQLSCLKINEEYEKRSSSEWFRVDDPGFLDLIAIDTVHVKNRDIVSHVGFFLSKDMMLHVNEVVRYSCVERLSQYGHKIIGYYRHGKKP